MRFPDTTRRHFIQASLAAALWPRDLMSRLVNDTEVIGSLFSQGLVQALGALFSVAGIVVEPRPPGASAS